MPNGMNINIFSMKKAWDCTVVSQMSNKWVLIVVLDPGSREKNASFRRGNTINILRIYCSYRRWLVQERTDDRMVTFISTLVGFVLGAVAGMVLTCLMQVKR